MTTSRVDHGLHLMKTDLIETAGENINDMTICRNAFGELVVILIAEGKRKENVNKRDNPT